VVTGHEPQRIHQALAGQDVRFVQNMHYQTGGMVSSVKVGTYNIFQECDAFFVLLLDQPLVSPRTLETLWDQWKTVGPAYVVPEYQKIRGHPLLIASRYAQTILSLGAGATLEQFVADHRERRLIVETDDPAVATALDTPQDYALLQRIFKSTSASREQSHS